MQRTLKFHIFESVDSTQEAAKKLKKESGIVHVVMALSQTQGKGTFGKKWVSPKNSGLYVTFAFETGSKKDISTLSHLAACAACRAIEEIAPSIKWPNDLLIKGQKIGGVITEVLDHHIFSGIGINLISDTDLKSVDQPYTSYDKHASPKDAEEVLEKLAKEFLSLLHLWEEGGFRKIKDVYKSFFGLMNDTVIIDTPKGILKGILVDFSDDGYPVLQMNTEILEIKNLGHINKDK